MSVTLSQRVRTLLRADAHGVIESLEERSLLLKQHLREAEIELDRKRARVEALAEECERLEKEGERAETARDAADADAALALAQGDEALARFALRKWLPLRDRAAALAEELDKRREERAALAARVENQAGEFDTLRRRVRAELALHRDDDRPHEGGWLEPAVAEEEVELELLRRRSGGES